MNAKNATKWIEAVSILGIIGMACFVLLFLNAEFGIFQKDHHNSSDLVGREIAAIYLDHNPSLFFSTWRKYTNPDVIDVFEHELGQLHTWPSNAPGTSCRRMSNYYIIYIEFVDGGSVKGTTRFYTCPPGFTFQRTVHDAVEGPLDLDEPVEDSVQEFIENAIKENSS